MCQYTRTVWWEARTSEPAAPSTMKNPGDSAGSSFGSGTLTATPERIWPPSSTRQSKAETRTRSRGVETTTSLPL